MRTRRFEPTSSTKLELQTLLWAIAELQIGDAKVIIHTDSQNIISLPRRRARFEANDFHSKKGVLLENHELYREFFRVIDRMDYEFVQVRGHKSSAQKNEIDEMFTLVDRASRNALREEKS